MSVPYPGFAFGGVDSDTEINGAALNDQFLDIVWLAASQPHMISPEFLLLPLPGDDPCDDVDVAGEEEVVVPPEDELVLA